MIRIIKLELLKSIRNKWFLLALLVGIVVTFLGLTFSLSIQDQLPLEATRSVNPRVESSLVYNNWVGGEAFSVGSAIYFFVFPILIAIPYGWSYCEEKNINYHKMIIVQTGRRAYFIAKYIAVFFSAGLAMIIPLVVNISLSTLFFPLIKPNVLYDVYYGVFGYSLLSFTFYTKPFLYLVFYLLIDFIYTGLLACLCLSAASFLKYQWLVIMVPFISCLTIEFATRFIYVSEAKDYYQMSPLYFLRPVQSAYPAAWSIILLSGVGLFVLTFLSHIIWESHREIY